jgi:hypothetical protein
METALSRYPFGDKFQMYNVRFPPMAHEIS